MQQQQQMSQVAINTERPNERERLLEQMREQELAQQRFDQENEILNRQREQQQREYQEREQHQSPRENHTRTIPIQQPVASRVPATLHGPNGILNDQHVAAATPLTLQAPLGAPSGPGNVYANGMHAANDNSLRPFAQQASQALPPQQLLGISNAGTPQLPSAVAALSQGQQPILNVSIFLQIRSAVEKRKSRMVLYKTVNH